MERKQLRQMQLSERRIAANNIFKRLENGASGTWTAVNRQPLRAALADQSAQLFYPTNQA